MNTTQSEKRIFFNCFYVTLSNSNITSTSNPGWQWTLLEVAEFQVTLSNDASGERFVVSKKNV